jgi:hypothetical protein
VRETEIPLLAVADCELIERVIDEAIVLEGLHVALRGSLKKYPGCVHWHVRRPGAAGTLEITLWRQQHRAWFTIQDGRRAPWIDGAVCRLLTSLQERLRGA